MAHLVKFRTLDKVQHTWYCAEYLAKFITLGKVPHTLKSAESLVKCGNLTKVQHPSKSAAPLEKCGTLGKVGFAGICGILIKFNLRRDIGGMVANTLTKAMRSFCVVCL